MKKKSPAKTKKNSSRQGRTVTKDNAGHIIEELFGVHIIGKDDAEHHFGASQKKSDGLKQNPDSLENEAKSESEKKKGNNDSNDTE